MPKIKHNSHTKKGIFAGNFLIKKYKKILKIQVSRHMELGVKEASSTAGDYGISGL